MDNDLYFMEKAYEQALLAKSIDEVPIGAIVVKDNEIISKAYNRREHDQQVVSHAETLAIIEACNKLNTWRLEDCTLYSTMEPCIMCSGVIINSRIKKVVYAAKDTRWLSLEEIMSNENKINHKIEIISGILEDKCSNLVKNYFKDKR